MTARDQQKLIREGFILIRSENNPSPRIKMKFGSSSEWRTMKKFETKAARDREMKMLLIMYLVIEV
jgi:hypothetical protein